MAYRLRVLGSWAGNHSAWKLAGKLQQAEQGPGGHFFVDLTQT